MPEDEIEVALSACAGVAIVELIRGASGKLARESAAHLRGKRCPLMYGRHGVWHLGKGVGKGLNPGDLLNSFSSLVEQTPGLSGIWGKVWGRDVGKDLKKKRCGYKETMRKHPVRDGKAWGVAWGVAYGKGG